MMCKVGHAVPVVGRLGELDAGVILGSQWSPCARVGKLAPSMCAIIAGSM